MIAARRALTACALALALASAAGCGVDRRAERADAALRADDLGEAEAGYRWVLEREPEHLGALYGLGWVYHLAGDPDRAREYFKRCVRIAPDDFRGYKGLGSVELANGNLPRAEEQFELARARAPGEASILNSLALVRSAADRHEEAVALLEEAIELAPERGEYGLNLAEALLRLRRYDEALAAVDAALERRIEERRFRAMLLVFRAQILATMSAGRVDGERCDETAPVVLTYLEAAERNLTQAEAMELDVPERFAIRRQVLRRRGAVTDLCPGAVALDAAP